MKASNELGYHWINKNSHSTVLASATGTEATAVRKHIQRKAKARLQVSQGIPIAAPASKYSRAGDAAKGRDRGVDEDVAGKTRQQRSKTKVARSKHHIRWRLPPSPMTKKGQAQDSRRAAGVATSETSIKLQADSNGSKCSIMLDCAILTAKQELGGVSWQIPALPRTQALEG